MTPKTVSRMRLPGVTLAILLHIAAAIGHGQSIRSVYTNLDKSCRAVEESTAASPTAIRSCPGIAGYKLLVRSDDGHADVTVVDPQGKRFYLNFGLFITPRFSVLGEKAEWRIVRRRNKAVPVALIVRVNAEEGAPDSASVTSYLAISKITNKDICVIDRIFPGPNQNEEARRAADMAVGKPCMRISN